MQKPIFSTLDFAENNPTVSSFIDSIQDLLLDDSVQSLNEYHQHFHYTRYQHSINVAYYSYLVCRKLKLDARSVARAGILHDMYLYDWKSEQPIVGRHSHVHPQIALENAKNIIETNPIIEDAILNHMWPFSPTRPVYKESWILQAIDKYCTVLELIYQCYHHKKFIKINFLFSDLNSRYMKQKLKLKFRFQ